LQAEHTLAHCAIVSDVGAAAESLGARRRDGSIRAEVLIVIMLSSQATAQVGAKQRLSRNCMAAIAARS
jgi:hypothetical protein